MTWFQAALNKNKTLAAAYVSISDILVILGQPDAAIVQLEIGLKEAAGNTAVQLALGDAYLKAGKPVPGACFTNSKVSVAIRSK